jgi:plastocyanin
MCRAVYDRHIVPTEASMNRSLRTLLAPLLFALGLPVAQLVAPAVALAGDPCYHDFDMPLSSVSTSPNVKALPCAFAPTVTYVPVGTTVTWSNGSDFTHLVTGANQDWGSRDTELPPEGSVSYTFDRAGVYAYACALHRGMVGAVVVSDDLSHLAPLTGGSGAAPGAGTGTPAETVTPPASPVAASPATTFAPLALAALVGGLAVLAVRWIVRLTRRPVAVKDAGTDLR